MPLNVGTVFSLQKLIHFLSITLLDQLNFLMDEYPINKDLVYVYIYTPLFLKFLHASALVVVGVETDDLRFM